MPTLAWTYTTLREALQSWPLEDDDAYVDNLDNIIGLGEIRVVRDLNLDIFDHTDSTVTLDEGQRFITKPTDLVQLRELRLGLVISNVAEALADDDGICASQATAFASTALLLNGAQVAGGSVTYSPPRVVTAAETTTTDGGIKLTITGTNAEGFPITEILVTKPNRSISISTTIFATVTAVTAELGSSSRTVKVGGAVGPGVLTIGRTWELERRSKAYCDHYAPDHRRADRPVYFNEYSDTQWQVVDTPDRDYGVVVHYVRRPTGLSNSTPTTWLGSKVPDLLLHACLLEAEHYLKADDRYADIGNKYHQELLPMARLELRNSIRAGDPGPFKPAASAAR